MSVVQDTTPASGWHRVSIGHLVMGIAFLGIVGVWALVQTETVTGDDIRWLLPIPWVFAGLVGLAATAVTGQRRYAVRQTGWVGEAPAPAAPRDESVDEDVDEGQDETLPVSRTADLPTYPGSAESDGTREQRS